MTDPLSPDAQEFADQLRASRERAEELEKEEREQKLAAFSTRRTAEQAGARFKAEGIITALHSVESALKRLPVDLVTKDTPEFVELQSTLDRIAARLKKSWPAFELRPVYLPRRPGVVRPPYGYVADEGGVNWRLAEYSHNPA